MNLRNRTIYCCDNLDVLRGINSDCIDLIYLDPPFNKKKIFSAPIGSGAEGASFRDIFYKEDVKEEWLQTIKEDNDKLHTFLESVKNIEGRTHYNCCYLSYMAIRLMEMHRVLKDTGSLYLHCDPTMSHYLKILLDILFGGENFRNEVVWKKTNSPKAQSKALGHQHDIILFYTKSDRFTLNKVYRPLDAKALLPYSYEDKTGKFRLVEIVARGLQNYSGRKQFSFKKLRKPWLYGLDQLNKWWDEGLIYKTKHGNYCKKQYLDDVQGLLVSDLFVDHDVNPLQGSSEEYEGFPTQKPRSLLKRILKISSHKGDMILDPFCGSATTCVASEDLGRRWVGIDVSVKAYELVKSRLQKEVHQASKTVPSNLINYEKEVVLTSTPPKRSATNG